MERARAHGSSAAEPPKVIVPPPTSAAILKRDRDEEVVRLAEEQLNVGKRQVGTGITRVRRFVERPVEANVTLHEEHVEVMRRTISARRDLKDIDWSEQIIEVRETVEQPVVSMAVRVAEEVVIRRKGSDHIKTFHDTVRKQELEVERLPAETVERVSESEAPRIGSPVSGIGSDRGMPVRYKSIQRQEHDRTER